MLAVPVKFDVCGVFAGRRPQCFDDFQRSLVDDVHGIVFWTKKHVSPGIRRIFVTGEKDSRSLKSLMSDIIKAYPSARIDYISIADPATLHEIDMIRPGSLLSLAVYIENVRLIDNMVVPVSES